MLRAFKDTTRRGGTLNFRQFVGCVYYSLLLPIVLALGVYLEEQPSRALFCGV